MTASLTLHAASHRQTGFAKTGSVESDGVPEACPGVCMYEFISSASPHVDGMIDEVYT
jgi:hypothetical protein